ncbi:hypothetical protein IAT38_003611 [Cryptococcus sp. DSM 104549]
MDLMGICQKCYFLISQISTGALILTLPPYVLPSRFTGISSTSRPSIPTISLIICTIARGGSTILDQMVLDQGGSTLCEVDAMVETYLTTAMVAHLPLVAIYLHRSLPCPKDPTPPRPSAIRNFLFLLLVYLFAAAPCVPTLTSAIAMGFKMSDGGFAEWWGFYCRDRSGWVRIIRPAVLLGPLVKGFVATVLVFSVLHSTSGHPSPLICPSGRRWAQAWVLLLAICLVTVYVVLEQTMGWEIQWWPRSLEAAAIVLLLLVLLFDHHIWRAYGSWIRFLRPPLDTDIFPGPTLMPSSSLVFDQASNGSKGSHKRTSSFWSPPRSQVFPQNTPPPVMPMGWAAGQVPQIPAGGGYQYGYQYQGQQPGWQQRGGGDGERDMEMMNMERQLHSHPHSIPDNRTPPTDLTRHSPASRSPSLPPGYPPTANQSRAPSPPFPYQSATSTVYSNATSDKRGSAPFQYATSTVYTNRQSLPFQYDDRQTVYDQNPYAVGPGASASTGAGMDRRSGLGVVREGVMSSYDNLRMMPAPGLREPDEEASSELSHYTQTTSASLARSDSQSQSHDTHLATPRVAPFSFSHGGHGDWPVAGAGAGASLGVPRGREEASWISGRMPYDVEEEEVGEVITFDPPVHRHGDPASPGGTFGKVSSAGSGVGVGMRNDRWDAESLRMNRV